MAHRFVKYACLFRRRIDINAIVFNLGVWFFIQLFLMAWHRKWAEMVSRHVETELLVAQLVATASMFVSGVLLGYFAGTGNDEPDAGGTKDIDPDAPSSATPQPTKSTISGADFQLVRTMQAEVYKVPIFFGAAMAIAGFGKAAEAIAEKLRLEALPAKLMASPGDWCQFLQPPIAWLLGGVALFALSAALRPR